MAQDQTKKDESLDLVSEFRRVAATANFDQDWDNWEDVAVVLVPEAGLELNVTRWFRMTGSIGYRFVDGFDGAGQVGKKDLNAPIFALGMRFGWFGGGRKTVTR